MTFLQHHTSVIQVTVERRAVTYKVYLETFLEIKVPSIYVSNFFSKLPNISFVTTTLSKSTHDFLEDHTISIQAILEKRTVNYKVCFQTFLEFHQLEGRKQPGKVLTKGTTCEAVQNGLKKKLATVWFVVKNANCSLNTNGRLWNPSQWHQKLFCIQKYFE